MNSHPILFSESMVKAILAGRKTQTRRLYKPGNSACPYGAPGDTLWVREAWRTVFQADTLPPRDLTPAHRFWYEASAPHQPGAGKYRPSMFMPRLASRITLRITDVRVERLQNISENDAIAEGIERCEDFFDCACWRAYDEPEGADVVFPDAPISSYRSLWDSINKKRGYAWDTNPWVWVISFDRVAPICNQEKS